MKQIAVRVDDDLLVAIEAARGEVPRERWMRAALASAAVHDPVRDRWALAATPADETPRPSPAGRKAKTEVASRPARSAATARQSASRPSTSPRASAARPARSERAAAAARAEFEAARTAKQAKLNKAKGL